MKKNQQKGYRSWKIPHCESVAGLVKKKKQNKKPQKNPKQLQSINTFIKRETIAWQKYSLTKLRKHGEKLDKLILERRCKT